MNQDTCSIENIRLVRFIPQVFEVNRHGAQLGLVGSKAAVTPHPEKTYQCVEHNMTMTNWDCVEQHLSPAQEAGCNE